MALYEETATDWEGFQSWREKMNMPFSKKDENENNVKYEDLLIEEVLGQHISIHSFSDNDGELQSSSKMYEKHGDLHKAFEDLVANIEKIKKACKTLCIGDRLNDKQKYRVYAQQRKRIYEEVMKFIPGDQDRSMLASIAPEA